MKYKVGDKVRVKSLEWYNKNKNEYGDIRCSDGVFFRSNMSEFCGSILIIKNIYTFLNAYQVEENDYYWTDEILEGLAEDTIQPVVFENIVFPNENYADKVELHLGDDYEIVVEDGRTFVQKKKPKYPTTYEECCRVLNVWYKDDVAYVAGYQYKLLSNFQKLLICRDAYWKITDEEMGLDKPWEPDWTNAKQDKFVIFTHNNSICANRYVLGHNTLAFPTEEMRDAFYENFKDLIEKCKELL